ncbi:hypothetical protein Cfor_12148 [Coptotermes formosanus]|uniref:Uncharacterized protein n=1 Tax=Coptotermes formosanus TaxID=36987 RepID=A0A6L2PK23_COPFO|nr:hypothetical protein Cfor_12148 [Coptotermes formosanus]
MTFLKNESEMASLYHRVWCSEPKVKDFGQEIPAEWEAQLRDVPSSEEEVKRNHAIMKQKKANAKETAMTEESANE